MSNLGLIEVYTGDGKGKTTAALGLALRACGHGYRVIILQFMKDDPTYGELVSFSHVPGLKIIPVGRNDFVNLTDPEKIDKDLAAAGWKKAQEAIQSGEYEIVILDEINIAAACKLLDARELAKFMSETKKNQKNCPEIVLTGRYAPQEFLDIADLITEMKNIRHPYEQGIEIREGIDH